MNALEKRIEELEKELRELKELEYLAKQMMKGAARKYMWPSNVWIVHSLHFDPLAEKLGWKNPYDVDDDEIDEEIHS